MSKTIYPIVADTDLMPFCLTGIGSCDSMTCISSAGDIRHQFVMTTGGEGIVNVSGKSFPQKKGSFLFLCAGTPYSFAPEGTDWSADWVTFAGSMAKDTLLKLGFSELDSAENADTEECENLFRQLLELSGSVMPEQRLVSTLLYAFILAAAQTILHKDEESYPNSITASVGHIDRHYSEDISLDRLSAISGVSPQHFCRVFRSKLGMRPMEYLARKRVAQAKILLGETDGSIGDIAKAVGFEDQNYFGITFRKYEGISPTEYRKVRGIREKG